MKIMYCTNKSSSLWLQKFRFSPPQISQLVSESENCLLITFLTPLHKIPAQRVSVFGDEIKTWFCFLLPSAEAENVLCVRNAI